MMNILAAAGSGDAVQLTKTLSSLATDNSFVSGFSAIGKGVGGVFLLIVLLYSYPC